MNKLGFHVFAGCLSVGGNAKSLVNKASNKQRMQLIKLDVTSTEDITAAKETVTKTLSEKSLELHGLVNNAGIWDNRPIEWNPEGARVDVLDAERLMAVNYYGQVRMVRAFVPLIRQSKGRVVNMASYLGRMVNPTLSTYAASKHAAVAFTEVLASEMKQFDVKVSSIEPWGYATGLFTSESVAENHNKAWSSASDEVRAAYGQEKLDQLVRGAGSLDSALMVESDVDQVVDQMVAALVDYEPSFVYSPMSIARRVGYWFVFEFLPADWRLLFNTFAFNMLGKYWPQK